MSYRGERGACASPGHGPAPAPTGQAGGSDRTDPARRPDPAAQAQHHGRWRALPAVLLAALLAQFDLFVINVAAPSLENGLHATTGVVQFAVGGYSISYGTLLVAGGRLGDVYGPRRMVRLGMVGFAVASATCALAQTGPQLVGARLVQGACAALMVPQVLALVTRLFPPSQRGRATAWFGVTLGVGAVSGQALGGYLVDHAPFALAWRSVFLVVVPFALFGTLLVGRLVPVDPSATGPQRLHLDVVGLLGLTASLMCVFVAVIAGPENRWPPWI